MARATMPDQCCDLCLQTVQVTCESRHQHVDVRHATVPRELALVDQQFHSVKHVLEFVVRAIGDSDIVRHGVRTAPVVSEDPDVFGTERCTWNGRAVADIRAHGRNEVETPDSNPAVCSICAADLAMLPCDALASWLMALEPSKTAIPRMVVRVVIMTASRECLGLAFSIPR